MATAANGGGETAPEAAADDSVAGSGSAAGAAPTGQERAWTATGWRPIPITSIGSGTTRGWNSDREWFNFSDNVDPWARWQPTEQTWNNRGYSNEDAWEHRDYKKKKDGEIPEWDGKSVHRTVYFRKIDLWAASTGVDKEDQAVRLLQKLSGEAFEKLENVKVDDASHMRMALNDSSS